MAPKQDFKESEYYDISDEERSRLCRHNIAAAKDYQQKLDDGTIQPFINLDIRPGGALNKRRPRPTK